MNTRAGVRVIPFWNQVVSAFTAHAVLFFVGEAEQIWNTVSIGQSQVFLTELIEEWVCHSFIQAQSAYWIVNDHTRHKVNCLRICSISEDPVPT